MAILTANTVLVDPSSGVPVALLAGNEVPEWAASLVGEHLLAAEAPDAVDEKSSVAQIDAYAAAHGIDLGDAGKKAEKLAAIASAEANSEK